MENGSRAVLLLDDFSNPDGRSLIGTSWQGFTDQVMGGRSIMQVSRVPNESRTGWMLRMQGDVSLANNGGFIQVRLPLSDQGNAFDGSRYQGVVLMVRGLVGKYAIHLRTPANHAPWSYYGAVLPVTETWARVEVPFSQFKGTLMTSRFNPAKLLTIAIFAGGAEFHADVSVSWLGFYE